ncbi:helicase protein MOM1-like isoform X1 [Aristolochia californica]|uniref:helicase protein MOM1-like isoform X1 n=2 Tax=Aristolochia californica TaxID=171875 RepID=UPI0035D6060C
MTSVTRSARRVKNGDNRSPKTANSGGRLKDLKNSTASGSAATDTSTPRRSAREASSKKQQLLRPSLNSKKPEKVENRAPSPPLSKRKSVCLEKQSTSRRYERWEKRQVLKGSGLRNSDKGSCSSSSKKSDKSPSSSGTKKSEKTCSTSAVKKSKERVENGEDRATTADDCSKIEKVGTRNASTPLKKKRLDARTYRASLGPQPKKLKQSALHNSSRGNGSVSKRDTENLGTCLLEEEEEGVDEWSGRKEGLLKKKHSEEGGEETIEASSSTPRKLVDGTSRNDGDRVEVTSFSRKRKFCSNKVHGPDFKESQSEDSDRILQVSPAEYMVMEKKNLEKSVDSVERAKMVCPMQECPATPQVIMITSSDGKPLTAEYVVDEGPTVGHSKKMSAPNLDSDTSGTVATLAAWSSKNSSDGFSLSTSSRNSGRLSDVCLACTKPEGVVNDSQIQEVCSCNVKKNCEGYEVSDFKDRRNHGVGDAAGIVKESDNSIQHDPSDGGNNVCVECKLGGKLLCCDGKSCGRNYHLSCLDPPLKDVPFGSWHCLSCVKKKVKFGVHSISDGVETICIINDEGMQEEKEYFVKYWGLSHVHNHWITESQLLQEAPMLLKKLSKEKFIWKKEWTEPQRLLRRRLVISQKDGNVDFGTEHSDSSSCLQEWLVKWKGLGYEEATWELENESFLSTADALKLMKNYENWHEKARKQSDPSTVDELMRGKDASLTKLSKLPVVGLSGLDHHLSSVNILRENWHKGQNAVVIDEQGRITTSILFILSLRSYVSHPFLVISSLSALPHWESEFMHLAPSLNVVVYNGDESIRKNIQALEFYDEGGRVLFEILLTIPDVIIEDINTFESFGWEAIIVDECQRPRLLKHLNLRKLTAGFKLLLASSQIKDNMSEYLSLLSHLEPDHGSDLNAKLINNDAANLLMLKEKVTRYLVSENITQYLVSEKKSDSSNFVEYLVPSLLSDIQLEQYCRTLVDNSMPLQSCLKYDSVGALRDMLISLRKCCDHPYLVEPSLQTTLAKGVPEILLDVGINASGKLQLIDKILSEVKKKMLRVVILFQTISGSGGIGDILDDYVRQRFGQDSYERVDSGLVPSKRQHALNIFNNLERGSFVFLLENRACRSSIKLSSVDAVIIFDSDWNPVNDLRALQKIHIDSRTDQLKVFRLYSPFTVEEKALILANKDTSLESNVQNITHTTSHMLLMWGASYLFDKLDEFHFYKSSSTDTKKFSYDDMVRDILAALQNEGKTDKPSNICSLMSKVHHSGAMWSPTSFLLGEREMLVADDGPPSVFWTKLLKKRFPSWKYLPEASQRPRKKAKYADSLSEKVEADNDELTRKCHKVVNSTIVDPITLQPWIEEQKRKAVSGGKEAKISDVAFSSLTKPQSDSCTAEEKPGILGARAENAEHPLPKPLNLSNDLSRDTLEVGELHMVESESCRKLRDAQKSLHSLLKPEISKLCETLELPEEVMHMAAKFLEYIMNNHHVNKEPKTILQAFMISLCWRAASLMNYKVNHKESLLRAKQIMEFECKEEEAESVYEKLRQLKKKFSHQMNLVRSSTKLNSLENQATSPSNPSQAMNLEPVASDPQCLAGEARGSPSSYSHFVHTVPLEHDIPPLELVKPDLERQGCNHMRSVTSSFGGGSENKTSIEQLCRQVEKTFSCRKKEILERQKKEILEFKKHKDEVKEKMRRDHRLEVDSIRATYANYSQRLDNLKLLIEKFSKKMKELDKHIDTYYKELVLMQYKARQKEDSMKAIYLVKANSGRLPVSLESIPLSETGFDIECMKTTEQSEVRNLESMLSTLDSVPESQVVVKVDSRSAELLVPTALPTTTSAPPQDENDGMNMGHSESITATAVGPLNQENLEGASLGSSSQVDNIPHSSRADNVPPSSKAKSSTDSCHDDPVLSHEVPSVEPNQPPASVAVVENVEVQIPNVTSFQMCGSSVSIPQPIESSEVDDSLMMINELQQNNEVSCSSEQIVVQRREPNTCPTLPAKQLNHSERLLASANSRRAGTLPDPSVLPGPSFRSPPIHPSAAGRPRLHHPDPLHNELAKIGREKDVATRTHEEEKIQLMSQCEKEIEEIRRKYNGLIQEVEMRLNQRLLVLDSHYNKVYMNRILAEVCKFKYELRLPVHLKQGTLSSASVQQYPRPFSQPLVSQTAQMPPRVPGSAPPFQVRPTSALFSGNPVSTQYPSVVPHAFPQGSAEVRAPPPHLHPHRSATFPSPIQGHLPLSSVIPNQQSSANVPPTSACSSQSPTSYPSSGPAVMHLADNPVMFQPNCNSALELLKDIDSRIRLNLVFPPPLAPNAGATLDAPELSQDRRSSPAVADANDATAAGNLVCLSDDD